MKFYYDGDESGGQILSWLKLQLKAIGTLWDARLPEAALTVIYSGIDSFGLARRASRRSYLKLSHLHAMVQKQILPRLKNFEATAITAADLYAARCGVLHTSRPLSSSEREGNAHQVFYQFQDKTGVNMFLNAKQAPVRIDIGNLGLAFKEGGIAFLTDLKNDPPSQKLADDRAQHFLRWVTVVS